MGGAADVDRGNHGTVINGSGLLDGPTIRCCNALALANHWDGEPE